MITDAYAAVSFICTDGLKLLMFVKFCKEVRSILQTEGNFVLLYLINNNYQCSNYYVLKKLKHALKITDYLTMMTTQKCFVNIIFIKIFFY